MIASVLIAYADLNFDQLKTLYEIQIQGAHSANGTFTDIVSRTVRQLWVLLLLAAMGIVYARVSKQAEFRTLLILAVFSQPLFLYHLTSQNVISLQKHLAFSSLFLIPIVAWGLNRVYSQGGRTHLRAALVLCGMVVFALINVDRLRTMQTSYPDVRDVGIIASHFQASDYVLSEDPYLFRYLLFNSVAQKQIKETTWFDNNKDGKYEMRDVKHAIWDRKFDYVFLNDQQHPEINLTLRKMLISRKYRTIFVKDYELQTMSGRKRVGVISLYQKIKTSQDTDNFSQTAQSLM